jgi:prepilin-type N-terminal cleavage/methylation domain-containing protein
MRIAANRMHGFSLLEVAIVLVILSLLGAGALTALRVQNGRAHLAETRGALDEARTALLNFAAANGRLPCPAASGSTTGQEDAACPLRGVVPWAALGIQGVDAWNHRLAYQISKKDFTDAALLKASLDGNINIVATAGTSNTLVTKTAVAFALWSYGENGYYATTVDGQVLPAPPASHLDEISNRPQATTEVVFHLPVEGQNAFDDEVIWMSRYILLGRMLEAGRTIQ